MKNFSFVFYCMCVEVSKKFKCEFISKLANEVKMRVLGFDYVY